MAIALGLAVAAAYGAADFLGGHTARGNQPLVVVAMTQLVALVLVLPLVALERSPLPGATALGFGAASGLFGLAGVVLLYRGLARGAMGIIAPVTAVGSAVVPAAWGLVTGERPSAPAYVGIVVSLVAVAIIASATQPGQQGRRTGASPLEVALAGAAGVAFGVAFILLAESGDGSGLWPVLAARLASVPAAFVAVGLLGLRPAVHPDSRRAVVAIGWLDAGAIILFLLATRRGLISLVAVVASLSPAVTVALARVVLKERLLWLQVTGLVLGCAGVILIAL